MGIPVKGKKLTATSAEWFRFENEGEWVIGRYVKSEDTSWGCKRHIIVLLDSDPKMDTGKVVAILGGKVLDDVLTNLTDGDLVGIEFAGFRRSPSSRRRYKAFMVYQYNIDELVEKYGKDKVAEVLEKEV